jgi:hypothetical protein
MNSPLKEIIYNFNNGCVALRDNNGTINTESVVSNLLKSKFSRLLMSNWTFLEIKPWDLLHSVVLTLEEHKYVGFSFKVDWILKFPCKQCFFILAASVLVCE